MGGLTEKGCRVVLLNDGDTGLTSSTQTAGIDFEEMELLKRKVSTHKSTFSAGSDLSDAVAIDPGQKSRPHYLIVTTRENLFEIKLLHHTRDMDCRRSSATRRNPKPRFMDPRSLEYRSSPMSLTLRALFLPVILYRIDSLVSMHELRHNVSVDVKASLPYNVMPESPAKSSRVSSNQKSTLEALSTLGQYFSPFDSSKMVPLFKLLEATTCANSNDDFDLERLEMLGDSFLKMAVSIHIYWHKNHKDEGKLTKYRTRQISNKNLFKLAKEHGLVGYIKYSKLPFKYDIKYEKWLPPGFTPPRVQNGDFPHFMDDDIDDVMDVYVDDVVTQMIPDKNVADSMEALIGAYFLHCGYIGALRFMRWLGVEVFHDEDTDRGQSPEGNRGKSPTPHYPSKYANYPMPTIEIPPDEDEARYKDILDRQTKEMASFEKKINYSFKNKV